MIALYTATNNFKTILENSTLRGSGVKVSGWAFTQSWEDEGFKVWCLHLMTKSYKLIIITVLLV